MNGRRGVSNLSIERSRQYLLERVINDSLQALKTLFAQSFALLWASGCWLEASVVAVQETSTRWDRLLLVYNEDYTRLYVYVQSLHYLLLFFSLEYKALSIHPMIVNTPPTVAMIRINRCMKGTLFLVTSTANG